MIDDFYKTCILPAAVNVQTGDGSPMSSMGKTRLHLWIADFKFLHACAICYKLPEADFLFGIKLKNSIIYPIADSLTDTFLYKGKVLF